VKLLYLGVGPHLKAAALHVLASFALPAKAVAQRDTSIAMSASNADVIVCIWRQLHSCQQAQTLKLAQQVMFFFSCAFIVSVSIGSTGG